MASMHIEDSSLFHVLIMHCVSQITADGSINCVDNPGEQEALVAQLLFCETVTALALLRQKGSFILKTFTTLEHHTVCLLYIINCCFSEVHVCTF